MTSATIKSATIDRKLFDDIIRCIDEAKCAASKAGKKLWVEEAKKALDAWLEKQ